MNRVICAGIRQGTSSLQERKVDGIHKQGDEGHVDSPRHICTLLHVCMLNGKPQRAHRVPTSPLRVCEMQASGHERSEEADERERDRETVNLTLVLHSYKTLLDSWDRKAIIFSYQIKEWSKMRSGP